MIDPQIKNSSFINLRSKGLTTSSGKLHKGCVKDAATKLSIGSIPSTYESIIYKNQSTKAFGTSEQRFHKKIKSPYQPISDYKQFSQIQSETTKASINNNSPNVVGYGPLISKVKREWTRAVRTPGPGQYNHESLLLKKQLRKCITKQENRKRKYEKICEKQSPDKSSLLDNSNKKAFKETPGPGQYFEEKKEIWKTSNKGWKSSFQTNVQRDKYIPESISPGPGVYELSPKMKTNNKENKQKIADTGQKKQLKNLKNNKFLKDIILEQRDNNVPGPGYYEHEIPDFRSIYQKIKISRNFIAPIHQQKTLKNSPGPNEYNVKRMYDNLTPKLLESSFFMSECKREAFGISDTVGPNLNSQTSYTKKKFHFNIKNQWV